MRFTGLALRSISMTKTPLLVVLFTVCFAGCVTVKMPELSQTHPAHPEAEAASVTPFPSVLQLPEVPVVAPAFPIPGDAASGTLRPSGPSDHSNHDTAAEIGPYVCPMHADVTSDSPGSCSKCGMALVKKRNS